MSTLAEQLINTEAHKSIFESAVRQLPLPVCAAFGSSEKPQPVSFSSTDRVLSTKDSDAVAKQFPKTVAASGNVVLTSAGSRTTSIKGKRVAVLFSGGPAAGGHNVVCGLKRVLGAGNTLLGVKAGPKGLLEGSLFEISDADVDFVLNTGGFNFLGSDRTKIKSDAQFAQVRETCIKHNLDAIVVVGGDDSNTNAAVLAESLFRGVKADGSGVQVIGVPKTIDGDLQLGDLLAISFGFDTATRIYSEMVGNILQDTSSSLKYWHFVKLMGRSASHVALEVALQTKPAITIISEEVSSRKMSLASIIDSIAKIVVERSHKGMNYGVLLAPEGLIEFIPEMNAMIAELNDVLAHEATAFAALADDAKAAFVESKLSADNAQVAGLSAALHRRHAARRTRLARQPASLPDPNRAVADRHDQGARQGTRRQSAVCRTQSLPRLRRTLRRADIVRRRLHLQSRPHRRLANSRRPQRLHGDDHRPDQRRRAASNSARRPAQHRAPPRSGRVRDREGAGQDGLAGDEILCLTARRVGRQ
jgi:pyrophosphate--fructose-6-phosphate 1-phosphotransferase